MKKNKKVKNNRNKSRTTIAIKNKENRKARSFKGKIYSFNNLFMQQLGMG